MVKLSKYYDHDWSRSFARGLNFPIISKKGKTLLNLVDLMLSYQNFEASGCAIIKDKKKKKKNTNQNMSAPFHCNNCVPMC